MTRRTPFPTLNAVYFVQPSLANIHRIIDDFDENNRLYQSASIFFTSPLNDFLYVRPDSNRVYNGLKLPHIDSRKLSCLGCSRM
jgi:hypothetical protein